MLSCYWLFQRLNSARVDRVFRPAQLLNSAMLSYSHGGNDAQKTMGIVVGLLVASKGYFATQTGWLHIMYIADFKVIPRWFKIFTYSPFSLRTLFCGSPNLHTQRPRVSS